MLAIKRFVAGFLATLVFHQVVIAALFAAKVIPRAPWNMAPVPPLGVPAVLSLAFWGGVWGIAMMWLIDTYLRRHQVLASLVIGALGPSLVAWYVVAPLKGRPPPDSIGVWLVSFAVNAAWGIGTLLIVRKLASARTASGAAAA